MVRTFIFKAIYQGTPWCRFSLWFTAPEDTPHHILKQKALFTYHIIYDRVPDSITVIDVVCVCAKFFKRKRKLKVSGPWTNGFANPSSIPKRAVERHGPCGTDNMDHLIKKKKIKIK